MGSMDLNKILSKYDLESDRFTEAMETLGITDDDLEQDFDFDFNPLLSKENVGAIITFKQQERKRRVVDRYIEIFSLLEKKNAKNTLSNDAGQNNYATSAISFSAMSPKGSTINL